MIVGEAPATKIPDDEHHAYVIKGGRSISGTLVPGGNIDTDTTWTAAGSP